MIPGRTAGRDRTWSIAMRWLCGVALLGASLAQATSGDASSKSLIQAVGAENEYANVIAQVGGRYVSVTSIMSNPNTDPHTFEVSTSVAREVASAQLIVQNGVGYDTFMQQLESASPSSSRRSSVPRLCWDCHEHEESAPLVQTSHNDPRRPVR